MKPRHLIEAGERVGAELRAIVRELVAQELAKATEPRFLEIEARQDRQAVVSLGHDTRIRDLEGADAQPELVGYTVAGFAAKVHRSKSAVRKMMAAGRLPLLPRLGVHPIIAPDAQLPPRRCRQRRKGVSQFEIDGA